jgi:hypothetical protein
MPESERGPPSAKRTAGAAVLLVLCCTVTDAVAEADYCIHGEFAIGCRSEQLLDELLAQVDNEKAFDKTLMTDLHAGACERFNDGEPVELVEQAQTSHHRRLRRPGGADAFWMPESYSKPIAECRAQETGSMGRSKLQPKMQAAPGGARGETTGCVIKPVMTDDEIAACRRQGH